PDHGLDAGALVGVEVAATDEVVGEGAGLVERPRLERGDNVALVDQPVLQREQAEEQVAVSGDGGHGEAPGRDAARDPAGHRAGARARGGVAWVALSHEAPWRRYPRTDSDRSGRSAPFLKESALLNWRTEFLLRWGLRPSLRANRQIIVEVFPPDHRGDWWWKRAIFELEITPG